MISLVVSSALLIAVSFQVFGGFVLLLRVSFVVVLVEAVALDVVDVVVHCVSGSSREVDIEGGGSRGGDI